MARITLNKIRNMHDLTVLKHKRILTLSELMVWYELSYERVHELINVYGLPHTNITGSLKFCRDKTDRFFSEQM